MYSAKKTINKRKKSLLDLEEMERTALETGDKAEFDKLKRYQNIIKIASKFETTTKFLHNTKRS
jgi:hypothetical protein